MIVDVKSIVENKKNEVKKRVESLKNKNIIPKLVIIKANSDEASKIYVNKKKVMCKEIGIDEEEYIFSEDVTNEDIINTILKLNEDKTVHGILVQLPMFDNLDEKKIINCISPKKDVDGLTSINFGNLITDNDYITPCTPKGILDILDSLNIDVCSKSVTVIGRSNLVGKPISLLLLKRGATITVCHSKTKNLSEHTKNADVLIVATGYPELIDKNMVKEGAVVIDVGITRTENGIKGDVKTDEVNEIASYVTPVPGGVGLTTVISLIDNVVKIAEKEIL